MADTQITPWNSFSIENLVPVETVDSVEPAPDLDEPESYVQVTPEYVWRAGHSLGRMPEAVAIKTPEPVDYQITANETVIIVIFERPTVGRIEFN